MPNRNGIIKQNDNQDGMMPKTIEEVNEQVDSLIESEPSVRFFGSEHWKLSGYLSSVLPTFFLAVLTSLVDYAKEDVTYMLQEWLFIVQRIN